MTLIESINIALKQAGMRTTVDRVVGSYRFGHYATFRFATKKGGHIMVKIHNMGGQWRLKAICSVINKYKPASMLVNGQAGKNCKQKAFWSENSGIILENFSEKDC